MAKRGAEALACRSFGCESFLTQAPMPKRSRSDPERKEPPCSELLRLKRKRAGAEEDEEEKKATSGGKRPSVVNGSGSQKERGLGAIFHLGGTTRPQEEEQQQQQLLLPGTDMEAAAGGELRDRRTPKPPDEHEDDVWHYNSFQYWRSPLPTIELSDILDLKKDDTVEARHSSSGHLPEMET
ncbi:uncharacterized protein C9orf40 homolog [Rhineura floridana]|uniref:uncharacterized protein C9orf40 homolog n=1 Tax=Rhineura floridana TaxID=261503 RepID=UPI002AC7FF87|nr:uncharacterized protein C9orf40 homolog [Rhineura floridana]